MISPLNQKSLNNNEFDCIVIGAGVIGAAVARSLLLKNAAKSVVVLEKEPAPAMHTSGRNSGVVHAGFNLKPGSLKAKFCVDGNARLKEFCVEKSVPLMPVGTLVTATHTKELSVLELIYQRGKANGVPDIELIEKDELLRKEPNAMGIAALYAPSGAITSGREVTNALVEDAKALGAEFQFGQKVWGIAQKNNLYLVATNGGSYIAPVLFNCAGLYADEVAHMMGVGKNYTIVPFRGEYFKLKSAKKDLVRSMIYPVPDLNYPFLGVHWTKMITGDLMIGPSAAMAFGRESYSAFSIGWKDMLKMSTKQGFWRLFQSKDFRRLAREQIAMSFSREKFISEAQRLVKGAELGDFVPGKNGNRAQVVDKSGKMVDDILVEKHGLSIHVLNAVSPGFTCSLPFADYLVDTLL